MKKVISAKRKKITSIGKSMLFSLGLPLLLILIWQFFGDFGILNTKIFPTPKNICKTAIQMLGNGIIQKDVVISLKRIIQGYFIGASIGILIGIFLGLNKIAEKSARTLIGFLRPIPIMAMVPFFILWLGIGEISKIALIALGTFWPVMINTMSGIKDVNVKFIEVAKIFNKSKFTIITKVVLPAARPFIFTGLRLGASSALSCVVVAEMFAASKGIGFRISFAREMGQPDVMFADIVVISIIGALIDAIFLKSQNLKQDNN